jgi:hypothetical protein
VLLNKKKDAITIYLEVFQRGFQINHIGKILTKKMEDEAIKRWAVSETYFFLFVFGIIPSLLYVTKQKLTDEKRYSYIRLMDQHNAKIEIQLKKIDEDVIKLREGKRVSAGYPRQNPPKEMDKVPEKKLMFNPVTWYVISFYNRYNVHDRFKLFLITSLCKGWNCLLTTRNIRIPITLYGLGTVLKRRKAEWRNGCL